MCTVQRAKYVVISLTVFSLVIYSCSLWTTAVQRIGNENMCAPVAKYFTIHLVVTYGDIIITLILPFLVILCLDIVITHRIMYFYSHKHAERNSKHSSLSSLVSTQYVVTSSRSFSRTSSSRKHVTFAKNCLKERAQIKLTKFQLIISSVFLVINLPSYIIRLHLIIKSFTQDVTQNISG